MTLNYLMEICGMQNIPSLLLLPDPLWLGVVAPDSPIYWLNRTF